MTDVYIDEQSLDQGVPMIYRRYPERVRLAYDPDQITEPQALHLLALTMPDQDPDMAIHRNTPHT